jgi:hypothetical protein
MREREGRKIREEEIRVRDERERENTEIERSRR